MAGPMRALSVLKIFKAKDAHFYILPRFSFCMPVQACRAYNNSQPNQKQKGKKGI
jgi:hypothetical protein